MLGLLLVVGLVAACHRPVTIVTPEGKAAYDADQVVLRLTEFSNVVKDDTGTAYGNVSYADAFTIIEWVSGDQKATPPTTGLVQLVQTAAGQGWKAAAREGWQGRIRAVVLKYPAIAPWAAVVDALLEVQ